MLDKKRSRCGSPIDSKKQEIMDLKIRKRKEALS